MFPKTPLLATIGFLTFAGVSALLCRPADADESPSTWYGAAWRHVEDTWDDGRLVAYAPFYTLHMPYAYTPVQIRAFNDFPAGGGLGKGHYNARGNWEGLLAMEFSDSHYRPQYFAGYEWIATWRPFSERFRVGAGVTGFVTARSDIRRYTPFPAALPLGSIGYGLFDAQAAFVPGGKGDGNVMIYCLKIAF